MSAHELLGGDVPMVGRVPARRLTPCALAGMASVVCAIGLLASSGWLITRASQRPPVFALSVAIGAVQAFALGRGIFRYLERLSVHRLSLELLGTLRLSLFDALEPQVPAGLGGASAGAVAAGFVADAELVATGFAKQAAAAIDVSSSVVIGAAVAAVIAPALALTLLLGAFAVALATLGAARVGRAGAEREARARRELAESVVDALRAAPELVAFGQSGRLQLRLDAVRRASLDAAWGRGLAVGLGKAGTLLTSGAGLIAVLAIGLVLHDAGRLSGVMLAVVAFVSLAVFDQLAVLPTVLEQRDSSRAAAEALRRLAASPSPAADPTYGPPVPAGAVGASLDGVTVASSGAVLLAGLSLDVPPRGSVALTGPSGSGKTTALYALMHFVNCSSGQASIGDVDVSTLTRAEIAACLDWMAEETHVFACDVAANLRVAQPTATDGDCREALDRAGLGPWLASLPNGLATLLGPGGRPVSSGERQRLGIARLLLRSGRIVLLDEPTAHLDPMTSPRLLAELMALAQDRAVVLVSHEPDVGGYVDRVVDLTSKRA